MADTATEFLLNNLKELLAHHVHLITDTRSQIEGLQRHLDVFRVFLRDTVNIRKENERTKNLVQSIHDVVYEVEDIMDAFVTKVIEKKHKSKFSRFWNTSIDLHSIGRKVEEVKEKVEQGRKEIEGIVFMGDDSKHHKHQPRPPRKKDVVGFEDVTEDLISRLTEETKYFDVISIIGMLGLGKTTVAWKILHDPRIVFNFPIRIWLPVSQQFTDKEIFLGLLKQVTTINDDIRDKDDHELADLVSAHLERGSFLIVLDDVWSTADWDRLRVALPTHNTKGKVLLTSRHETVGTYASNPRPLYKLRFFTFEESWELFCLEALREVECPPELKNTGELIARNCDGLPLAIVVIGGILATMYSPGDLPKTKRAWAEVSERVNLYVAEYDPANRIHKLISMSYDKLPYHLRACFLYLGMFPEDYEIPASKLIHMWIGEGFIHEGQDYTLEETGEKYLQDLVDRNLVKSETFKPDGKVKTCRIHDTLREFCRIEGSTENFLQEIKPGAERALSSASLEKHRRLCIHSNCSEFIASKPFGPCVRSFVTFSKDKYEVSPQNSPNIVGAFKLLRVLHVLPFKFTKIDTDLYNLVHMRYIALSCNLSLLPSKFNQLWNIQTLIVDTTSLTLEVKANIWKMTQLRHFKTNASATLLKSSKSDKCSKKLQTLGTISAESCTEELSHLAPNLKKLSIRGQLALLFEKKIGSFDSLRTMEHLGKLKLINDAYPKPPIEGRLLGLPNCERFPFGLTSLTLCATFLSWGHMSTIGLLKNLEVLKLKDSAFVGSIWEAVDGGFQCLEMLHIEETDLIVWNASSHHYPKLRGLVLRKCEKLLRIPIELAGIQSLQKLELYTCISAAKSARAISYAKKGTPEGTTFMLSIYPPIE